jgi:hypothetical protein
MTSLWPVSDRSVASLWPAYDPCVTHLQSLTRWDQSESDHGSRKSFNLRTRHNGWSAQLKILESVWHQNETSFENPKSNKEKHFWESREHLKKKKGLLRQLREQEIAGYWTKLLCPKFFGWQLGLEKGICWSTVTTISIATTVPLLPVANVATVTTAQLIFNQILGLKICLPTLFGMQNLHTWKAFKRNKSVLSLNKQQGLSGWWMLFDERWQQSLIVSQQLSSAIDHESSVSRSSGREICQKRIWSAFFSLLLQSLVLVRKLCTPFFYAPWQHFDGS